MGSVQGLVIDALAGQVSYLLVETGAPMVLLPWQVVQMSITNPSPTSATTSPNQPALTLVVNGASAVQALADAPQYTSTGTLAQAESQARTFWSRILANQSTGSGNVPTGNLSNASDPVTSPSAQSEPVLIQPDKGARFALVNQQGDSLGILQDLIISQEGVISFALLNPNPALNLKLPSPQALLALSYNALSWDSSAANFSLTVSQSSLDAAPRYDPNDPTDFSLPGWQQAWDDYWMSNLTSPTPTAVKAQSGSFLMGDQLIDSSSHPLGSTADWVFDQQGSSQFIVVNSAPPDSAPQQAGKFTPVPWAALDWTPSDNHITFKPNPAIFKQAPRVNSLAVLTQNQWLQPVVDYWQQYVQLPAELTTSRAQNAAVNWLTGSQIMGMKIVDADQNPLGPALGMTLSPDGTIQYLLLNRAAKAVPVPWSYFSYDPKAKDLLYTDDPQLLATAPAFDSPQAVKNLSPSQDQELRTFWGMK